MVAVLHHLDLGAALTRVREVLAPGGRLLVVGLAPPASVADHLWDAASMVANPLIGWVTHPWPSPDPVGPPPFPVADPVLSFDEVCTIAQRVIPGSVLRHRIGFRFTLEWEKPC